MRIGIVTSPERIADARVAGADYLEPTIAGGLVAPAAGGWAPSGAYDGAPHPAFAVLFPGALRLADPGTDLGPAWDYLDAALPVVASVAEPGAVLVLGSGTARRIPDGADRDAAEERFAEAVRGTRDRAARHGLAVALEPLSADETNLLHTVGDAAAFLDAHGIEGVRINADLFHMRAAGEDPAVVGDRIDRIGHVHLADGGRRFVGAGGSPWRDLLAILRDGGYAGDVSLECTWGDDPAQEMRTSVELVRSAL